MKTIKCWVMELEGSAPSNPSTYSARMYGVDENVGFWIETIHYKDELLAKARLAGILAKLGYKPIWVERSGLPEEKK